MVVREIYEKADSFQERASKRGKWKEVFERTSQDTFRETLERQWTDVGPTRLRQMLAIRSTRLRNRERQFAKLKVKFDSVLSIIQRSEVEMQAITNVLRLK